MGRLNLVSKIYFVVLLISSANHLLAQSNIQNKISKSWLTSNGFQIHFKENGNIVADDYKIKNYWLSKDTILFSHYEHGGTIKIYSGEKNPIIRYDTVLPRTFFSRFQIEKLTEDSLLLSSLDSVAFVTLTSIVSPMLHNIPESNRLKLFALEKVYQEFNYDSVRLNLAFDGHFSKWDKEFIIYSNGDYNYRKTWKKYTEDKEDVVEYKGKVSSIYKVQFQEILNKSGIQFLERINGIRSLTHSVRCDLKIFCNERVYNISDPRAYLPKTIEKIVYHIYQLEKESE